MVTESTTKHSINMMNCLPGQIRKGLTLSRAISKYSRLMESVNTGLLSNLAAAMISGPIHSVSKQEFVARLEYFTALAMADIKFSNDMRIIETFRTMRANHEN